MATFWNSLNKYRIGLS